MAHRCAMVGLVKPYYADAGVRIYLGDNRKVLPELVGECFNLAFVDQPYGETSLKWDVATTGWLEALGPTLAVSATMWVCGSQRMFLEQAPAYAAAGWKYAQDVIWEKHNGSNFRNDRFRRVHESVVQFYRPKLGDWEYCYKNPQMVRGVGRITATRHKDRPSHMGTRSTAKYVSEDGGPRLMRSVIKCHSCHGYADNPTQKPVGLVEPLLAYACPPGGKVIDPYMGSGTTLVVARQLGMQAVGIERRKEQCEAAVRRLGQQPLNFSAP